MTQDEKWLLDEKYGGVGSPAYEADKERLAKGEPLGYVIGSQPFLGLTIYLDSHPLIPRVETEWWTDKLLSEWAGENSVVRLGRAARSDQFLSPVLGHRKMEVPSKAATEFSPAHERPLTFLDLCSGSGAIGCAALARLPHAEVYFGEIDPALRETILKNIRENGLDETRAHLFTGDLFDPFPDVQFDIIASNPPYVPSGRVLPESVADYEPSLALFAGENGLDILERIAIELPHRLSKRGVAWIECDRGHAEAARDLFVAQGFTAEIRTDQYDKPRIVVVSFP